jgi:hypothetical protein
MGYFRATEAAKLTVISQKKWTKYDKRNYFKITIFN